IACRRRWRNFLKFVQVIALSFEVGKTILISKLIDRPLVGIYNKLFLFEIYYRYDKERVDEYDCDLVRIVYGNARYQYCECGIAGDSARFASIHGRSAMDY